MPRTNNHVFRLITVRYWIALVLIAAALTGSYILLGRAIDVQRDSFRIVTLAADQIIATQRVCFLSHAVVNAKTAEDRQDYRRALDNAVNNMMRLHEVLSLRTGSENIPPGMRSILRHAYYHEPEPLDEQENNALRDARTISNADTRKLETGMAELMRLSEAGNRTLVNEQLELFDQLQDEARNTVARIRFLGTVLWILTLALLAVEIPLIFRPMARRAGRALVGLQAERRKAVREAEAADAARESQASFIRTMSHELRTPLNAILGLTQMMKAGISPEKRIEYTADIHQAGRHLLDLINDILELSRLDAGQIAIELVPTSLRDELEWTVSLLRPLAAEKSLDLSYESDPGLAGCYLADGARIRQILVNLVGNALKFTQQGSIVVRAAYEGSAGEAADLVRFEVRDTGIGVPAEMRARIFEEFQQADNSLVRKHGGSGLGLAISSRLVKLMNGTIGVESVDSGGSVFWFTLPLQWTAGRVPQPRKAVPAHAVPRRLRVLIVDAAQTRRENLKQRMRRMGHEVITVASCSEALATTMELIPDVLLIDVDKFGMSAVAAVRAIRQLPGTASGVFMIGLASNESGKAAEEFLNAGADLCLGKPLDFDVLRSHLAERSPS